jgi:5-methylcytosine-specific restriction endonuclease McrA
MSDRSAYYAQWRTDNHEAKAAADRAYYLANKDRTKARVADWKAANPERVLAGRRKYAKAHADSYRVYCINRRRRLVGKLSARIAEILMERQNALCPGCGDDLCAGYHIDHVRPIARGGANQDWNVQLLCPPCNLRKGASLTC